MAIRLYAGIGAALLATVFTLSAVTGSFYTVNEGERGVIVTQGKVVGVAGPGFNWKTPLITNVTNINVRNQTWYVEGLAAYTRDQQVATTGRISVNFTIDATDEQVKAVYAQYGSAENLVAQVIGRRVNDVLEKVFGQYNAERAVQERTKLGADFTAAVQEVAKGTPIIITSVQIEDISFPAEYEAIINQRMAAEVEVKKLEQQALQAKVQAEIAVTQAQATADSQVATATANAEAVRLLGEAEATAIRAKGEALIDNPALVELTKAERWNGVLPTTMLPGNTVPFIDVSPATAVGAPAVK